MACHIEIEYYFWNLPQIDFRRQNFIASIVRIKQKQAEMADDAASTPNDLGLWVIAMDRRIFCRIGTALDKDIFPQRAPKYSPK